MQTSTKNVFLCKHTWNAAWWYLPVLHMVAQNYNQIKNVWKKKKVYFPYNAAMFLREM